jgi:hypothetical protein
MPSMPSTPRCMHSQRPHSRARSNPPRVRFMARQISSEVLGPRVWHHLPIRALPCGSWAALRWLWLLSRCLFLVLSPGHATLAILLLSPPGPNRYCALWRIGTTCCPVHRLPPAACCPSPTVYLLPSPAHCRLPIAVSKQACARQLQPKSLTFQTHASRRLQVSGRQSTARCRHDLRLREPAALSSRAAGRLPIAPITASIVGPPHLSLSSHLATHPAPRRPVTCDCHRDPMPTSRHEAGCLLSVPLHRSTSPLLPCIVSAKVCPQSSPLTAPCGMSWPRAPPV